MSNCVNVIYFEKNTYALEMRFEGEDYNTASVKFKLSTHLGVQVLGESAAIPVKMLFNLIYLADQAVLLNAIRAEQEVIRLERHNNGKEEKHGKEDKKASGKSRASRSTVGRSRGRKSV